MGRGCMSRIGIYSLRSKRPEGVLGRYMRSQSALEVSFVFAISRWDAADDSEDWLNPAYTLHSKYPNPQPDSSPSTQTSQSDFRFTYLGPAGTFTPLHRDVYASYSWSANIVGRKIWWLFPPDPEIWRRLGIQQDGGGSPVFDVRVVEGDLGGMKILQEVSFTLGSC
jgi:hypothetical protein